MTKPQYTRLNKQNAPARLRNFTKRAFFIIYILTAVFFVVLYYQGSEFDEILFIILPLAVKE